MRDCLDERQVAQIMPTLLPGKIVNKYGDVGRSTPRQSGMKFAHIPSLRELSDEEKRYLRNEEIPIEVVSWLDWDPSETFDKDGNRMMRIDASQIVRVELDFQGRTELIR